MKIKKSIILIILLICSGCSAQYRIDFNDDKITENLSITTKRNGLSDEQVKEMYSEAFYAINRESFYKFDNSKSTLNEIILNYNYNFNTSNISSSNLLKTCIEYFDFFREGEKYYLTATGAFKCSMYEYIKLDSLDVSIKTNHNVLENNADEVKNNEYIWHIDLNNIENINIKLITDNKVSKQSKKEKFTIKYKEILIVVSIATGLLLFVLLLIFIRHKRVNKI